MAENGPCGKMQKLAVTRQKSLSAVQEMQVFNTNATETIAFINDLQSAVSSSTKPLVKVHETPKKLKDNFSDLDKKVVNIKEKAHNLRQDYPEHTVVINEKQHEIELSWANLADTMKTRFLTDFQTLVSWFKTLEKTISAEGIAKDLKEAKVLIEKHQQYKVNIDAQESCFARAYTTGEILLEWGNLPKVEIQENLDALSKQKTSLLSVWEERQTLYNQCLSLHTFYRDIEDADTWLKEQEKFLENDDVGDSLSSARALLKKHDEFEQSLAAQAVKIQTLDDCAKVLITGDHYAAHDLSEMRVVLSQHKEALLGMTAHTSIMLEDSQYSSGRQSSSQEGVSSDLNQHETSGQDETEEADNRWTVLLKMAQKKGASTNDGIRLSNIDKNKGCTEVEKTPVKIDDGSQNSTSTTAPKRNVEGLENVIASLKQNRKKLEDMIDQIGDSNPQLLEKIYNKQHEIDQMIAKFNA